MSRRTYARIAGWTFLLYIATGVFGMVLNGRAEAGAQDPAAILANLAGHAALVRAGALLVFLQFLYALVLGVALHALTRDVEPHLALFGAFCRFAEGMLGAYAAVRTLGLVQAATASIGGSADAAAAGTLGALLLNEGRANVSVAASCFAVGSTAFCYLFWRGRSIPTVLAGLGLVASLTLVVGLPLQIGALLRPPFTLLMWVPMTVFEIALAAWLIVKGVAAPDAGR